MAYGPGTISADTVPAMPVRYGEERCFMNTTIHGRLTSARIAIQNALADEGLRTKLMEHGCTLEDLEAGRQLYEEAVASVQAQ